MTVPVRTVNLSRQSLQRNIPTWGLAAHAMHLVRTTVRAGNVTIPARGFQVRQHLGFVVKDGIGDIDIHGGFPLWDHHMRGAC